MTWTVEYVPDHDMVQVTVIGAATGDDLSAAGLEAIRLAKAHNTTSVLIDDMKLERAFSLADIYALPKFYLANQPSVTNRVAIILPTSQPARDNMLFYETVCRNRGLNHRTFDERQEAMAWLKGTV